MSARTEHSINTTTNNVLCSAECYSPKMMPCIVRITIFGSGKLMQSVTWQWAPVPPIYVLPLSIRGEPWPGKPWPFVFCRFQVSSGVGGPSTNYRVLHESMSQKNKKYQYRGLDKNFQNCLFGSPANAAAQQMWQTDNGSLQLLWVVLL